MGENVTCPPADAVVIAGDNSKARMIRAPGATTFSTLATVPLRLTENTAIVSLGYYVLGISIGSDESTSKRLTSPS